MLGGVIAKTEVGWPRHRQRYVGVDLGGVGEC